MHVIRMNNPMISCFFQRVENDEILRYDKYDRIIIV